MRIPPPIPIVFTSAGQKVGVRHFQAVLAQKFSKPLMKPPVKLSFDVRVNFQIALFAKAKECLHSWMHDSGKKLR